MGFRIHVFQLTSLALIACLMRSIKLNELTVYLFSQIAAATPVAVESWGHGVFPSVTTTVHFL